MVNLKLNRLRSHGSGNKLSPSRSVSPAGTEARTPPLLLKVVVLRARNLAAKDRSGTSDPYLVVNLGDVRAVTHAVYKTLNPEWNISFEMPMNGLQSLLLECICWDKDRFGKDYLGEFDVSLEDVFANGQIEQEPFWYTLRSNRKSTNISGQIQLQFSLIDPSDPQARPEHLLSKFQTMAAVSPDAEEDENDDGEEDEDDEDEGAEPTSDETDDPSKPESMEKKKRRLRLAKLRRRKKKTRAFEFMGGSDVVGIIFLEISRITDLPPERNVTRTSFDMDPFVVASLGKKTYRTRVIRHNLNPVFDERMIFQVQRHEQAYSLSFSIVDRDKLSGNDFVGTASLPAQEIISTAPEADPETGLYRLRDPPEPSTPTPSIQSKSRFKLPSSRSSSSTSLNRLAYRPALASRKSSSTLFGNGLLQEPTSIPDGESPVLPNLNTTDDTPPDDGDSELRPYRMPLSLKNKDRWESKHYPELYIRAKYAPYPALRQQFWRAMLKQYDVDESGRISKVELTTMLDTLGSTLKESTIDSFFRRFADDNGSADPNNVELTFDQAVICLEDQLQKASQKKSVGETIRHHLPHVLVDGSHDGVETKPVGSDPVAPTEPLGAPDADMDELTDERGEEHVVEIQECPICHQPRLRKKTDADIITHIATCASHDWRQVNNLVMAEFVTSSQAQRKWYSKVITKISYGGYKLGANSANILVQDRITGQIMEERMSVYVRLGIRLLYKGLKSREMEKKRIRKLLRSLSVKQGRKFDDPASAREIPNFINFHKLNTDEVLLPLDQFRTFNEFFYRALKPGARPCSAPDHPKVVVSPADCRTVVFNRVDDATAIWIKGREFSIARLLGNAYPADAKRYVNGALGVFRLAPQDYHRFHIPVDGVMDQPKLIPGEYYTVNPMAIRSALDVYGENVRVIVPIDSVAHGRVMVVCIGAMMVGSTVITAKAGQRVNRADELGYFKFGGSTIVVLFEPGVMKFDEDLVGNSKGALETLIRVGMSIGRSPDEPAYTADMQKSQPSQEEQLEARRRIGGAHSDAPPEGINGSAGSLSLSAQ
ncbi:MAG: hypothetical protein M1823_001244 [Watsoniomyces obsoletus]|nr:MAG: hypothetical protein M1823_001244 [Watsoniomyces obsoletus]